MFLGQTASRLAATPQIQAQSQGLVTGYARGQSSTTSVITLTPLQGNWGLPIDLSVVKLSSEFGVQRPGHKHGGLDLSTQGKNYPVYATEDNGKVVTVGKQDKGAGNYVVIEYDRQDGTKIQTTYMHLNPMEIGRSLTLSYTSLKWRLEVIKRQLWIRMETMR